MSRSVQELQYSIQTLALPVTAQLRLHRSKKCRVRELAQAFAHWQSEARDEWREMSSEQTAVLNQLDQELMALCKYGREPKWSDSGLRHSRAWQHVRQIAREALLLFDWPLDVPPIAHQ